MEPASHVFCQQANRKGGVRFALVLFVLAIVWLVVLPRVALLPRISARNEWLREKQINPAAMYYTEVEALESKLRRMDARSRLGTASSASPH